MHEAPALMTLDDYEASLHADLLALGIQRESEPVQGQPIEEDEETIVDTSAEGFYFAGRSSAHSSAAVAEHVDPSASETPSRMRAALDRMARAIVAVRAEGSEPHTA